MKETIEWINDALATKNLGAGMTHYRVRDREIRATNGRITCGHPWPTDGSFLVPGVEFEKVLKRMPGKISISVSDKTITLRSERFRGTIETLPLTEWDYPGVDSAAWLPLPSNLLRIVKEIRPFVLDEAPDASATCVALERGFVYATNNIVIAGAPCPELGDVMALLPNWAVDFIIAHEEHLTEWAWSDNYVAFKWRHGAWMRSQLVVGQFTEKAAAMVREAQAQTPTQHITDEFRDAFKDIAELADDTVAIYADRIESRCGKAEVVAEVKSETPEGGVSLWGAKFIMPAIATATSWSPAMWPRPTVFRGDIVAGLMAGRKA